VARFLLDHASKILVQGIQGVRLQFGEFPAQNLFNAVNVVEKSAAVDFQLAAAEFPVGAEEKEIPENAVFRIFQDAPANQGKVSDKLFPFTGVSVASRTAAAAVVQGNRLGLVP
jgi:hypothetical protein